MLNSFGIGKILCVALLILILANAVLYVIVTHGLYTAKPFDWVNPAATSKKYQNDKGLEAIEFYNSKKLHLYGSNVINLISAFLVVALINVG